MQSKYRFMNFRVYAEEVKALEVMAQREGRNRSEMLRELIREGCERRGLQAMGLVGLLGEHSFTESTPR